MNILTPEQRNALIAKFKRAKKNVANARRGSEYVYANTLKLPETLVAQVMVNLGGTPEDAPTVAEVGHVLVPDYIEADHTKMTAKFLRTPKLGDVPYAVQMQPSLVVEFYSR